MKDFPVINLWFLLFHEKWMTKLQSFVQTQTSALTSVYLCVCYSSDRGDGVQGSIGSDAEVWSRNIVRDGSWDNYHGDTQLLIPLPGLDQLQTTWERLCGKRIHIWIPDRYVAWIKRELYLNNIVLGWWMASLHGTHFETSYNDQGVNVVLGNVQAYVFYVLCWKSSAKKKGKTWENFSNW